MYMRNATAAIIVYDITCRKSFEEVDKWVSGKSPFSESPKFTGFHFSLSFTELNRCAGIHEPLIFLIGNKSDLESIRQVTEGEGLTKAAKLNAHFFEVSAYNSAIIDSVFATLAEEVHERMKEDASEPTSPTTSSPTSSRESPIFRLLTSPLRSRSPSGDLMESKKNKSCCIQ